MRRIRLPLGRGLFFLCALLFALVALLPLRLTLGWLALDTAGLAARQVEGSIWLGLLREARVGNAPMGDLRARLDPLPLVAGRARVDLDSIGGDAASQPLSGAVSVSRHTIGVDDLTASLSLGSTFAPLPIAAADFSDVSVRFRDGLCDHADGLAKVRLAGDIGGVSLPAGLTGNARCEGGALLLPLSSQGGGETLSMSIQAGGRYRAEFQIRPDGDGSVATLTAAGFRAAGDRLRLTIEGTM